MILLYNGQVYSPGLQATALAIQGKRIIAAGSDVEILALETPGCEKVNLHGKTVWPGLTDSHLHLEMYSASLTQVDCETSTIEECLVRVKDCVARTQAGNWVVGHGWNQNVWPGGFGNGRQLDEISDDHPVFLTDKSIHAAWVNSRALQLAGIDRKTPDPDGGIIQRDAQGLLTGILFENATALVENLIPVPSKADQFNAMMNGQAQLHRLGLTGIHDFDRSSCFATLQDMKQAGKLTLRVAKSIPFENLDEAVLIGLHSGFEDDSLCISSVKMFADGALGPQTAAMLAPYEGNDSEFGTLLLTADEVFETGIKAVSHGLSLAIHAIGDRATNEVLNGFAMLREYETRNHHPHLPHRVEHLQLLHPDDLQKAATLGIVASMQPIHTTSDMFTADRHWGKRARYAYAFNSLLKNGTTLIFGSDAPVESPNPFWGMHAAVTRRRQNGDPGSDGWYSEERISLAQALDAYTKNPASAVGKSSHFGQLKPGMYADLIVLAQNPFKAAPQTICNILPEAVMVGGEWVYN
jgi:predicted amidohydrolase YtcJ